jgi:hypothetical protein
MHTISRHGVFTFIVLLLIAVQPVVGQDTIGADYFGRAEVDNPTPFVGEQIAYRFRFYDAVGVTNSFYEAPNFEDLWRFDRGRIEGDEDVYNRRYKVISVVSALYPTRTGQIVIAPGRVTIPKENVFGSLPEVKLNAVTLQVKALPDGAPAGFKGAVGQFNLMANLDRDSVKLGELVTLQLVISGTGNVEQMPMPDISVPQGWKVYPKPAVYSADQTSEQVVGKKVYELSLLADRPGTQTLPPVNLRYFDPRQMIYRSVSTNSITIYILPSDNTPVASSVPIASIPSATDAAVLPLKPISGLMPNGNVYPNLLFWLLWLIPPLSLLGVRRWTWEQARKQRDRAKIRQSSALQEAQERLQTAQKMNGRQAYALVSRAIWGYFGDFLDRAPQGLTQATLRGAMKQAKIDARVCEHIIACLETADEGQYAPSEMLEVSQLANRVLEALSTLDSAWKAR